MRYTRIEIDGYKDGCRAVLMRTPGDELIEVHIFTPDLLRPHMVRAHDRNDLHSMAECLQRMLDGYRGTSGDVLEYVHVLSHLAD